MRLLNTHSLTFGEFFSTTAPIYAILSHRWTSSETTLQAFTTEREEFSTGEAFSEAYRDKAETDPGLWKIVQACALARSDVISWIWIDTCCIDKTSSAELSEAINSMFDWYRESFYCYAYLDDVSPVAPNENVRHSKWHTRGWTLQELLAPQHMGFYDAEWTKIGTRRELAKEISAATGVEAMYLIHGPYEGSSDEEEPFQDTCIATKMSWIAKRETSRVEDMAHCMLGIFGVNMPLLYGEGKKAFMRLQLEILKKSDDESLFAWCYPDGYHVELKGGMLAPGPWAFEDSEGVRRYHEENWRPMWEQARLPYAMSNKGLEFRVLVDDWDDSAELDGSIIEVGLNCYLEHHQGPRSVWVTLRKEGHTWVRIERDTLRARPSLYSAIRRPPLITSHYPWPPDDGDLLHQTARTLKTRALASSNLLRNRQGL